MKREHTPPKKEGKLQIVAVRKIPHISGSHIFPKTISPEFFPGLSQKNLSVTRDERPVRDFSKNAASHLS